jgi:hypothetical protein
MADGPLGSRRAPTGSKPPTFDSSGEETPVIDSLACKLLAPLGQTEHFLLLSDSSCQLVLALRTRAPFERIFDIDLCFREMERILLPVPRNRYVMLVDARSGPSRNDEGFENAMKMSRRRILSGFLRYASLVATAAGRLQINRFAKEDGLTMMVTEDEKTAFSHLGLRMHELPRSASS